MNKATIMKMTREQISNFDYVAMAQLVDKRKDFKQDFANEGFSPLSDMWKIQLKGQLDFNGKAKAALLKIFRERVLPNKKILNVYNSLKEKREKLFTPTKPLNGLGVTSERPSILQLKTYIETLEKEINDAHQLLNEQKIQSRVEVHKGVTGKLTLKARIEELILNHK